MLLIPFVKGLTTTSPNHETTHIDHQPPTQLSWNVSFFRAASDGDIATIDSLLALGANVNEKEIEGETPLMYASSRGQTQAVLHLLKNGADIHAVSENGERLQEQPVVVKPRRFRLCLIMALE
jgi:hypothetical protein